MKIISTGRNKNTRTADESVPARIAVLTYCDRFSMALSPRIVRTALAIICILLTQLPFAVWRGFALLYLKVA